MTTRAEQRQQTRQRILRAAIEALAEGGSKSAGLIGIGKRAGVTHSTVLYHFGSAHELQKAVLNERDLLFFREVVGGEWTAGPLAALLNLEANAGFTVKYPQLARLFVILEAENCDQGQPLHQYFVDRRRAVHDVLLAIMQAAIDAGEIRADVDLDAKADEMIAFQMGAQIMWASDPEKFDLMGMYRRYADDLRRELVPPRRRRTRPTS